MESSDSEIGLGARMLSVIPALDNGWNWNGFKGSQTALKYNRRDLASIEAVLELVPGRTAAVQAGGHLGIFPKALARVFTTVYTFEPAPDLFAMLQHNAPEPNIVKLQAAVGDMPLLVGLSRARRSGTARTHEGLTHVSGAGTLPTLRIDDLHLPVCDLICLDVEGYELFALQGASDTIRRCRPVIAVEINRGIEFVGYTGDDVRRCIRDRGYRSAGSHQSDEFYVPEAA